MIPENFDLDTETGELIPTIASTLNNTSGFPCAVPPSIKTELVTSIPTRTLEVTDIQYIDVAKRYPREAHTFIDRLYNLATADMECAENCYYSRFNRQKNKEEYYESIRLTELAVNEWRNIKIFLDEPKIDIENKLVSVRAIGMDYESANQISIVKYRNLTKQEITFLTNYDKLSYKEQNFGLATKVDATMASAYRACVQKLIPRIFMQTVMNKIIRRIHNHVDENKDLNMRLQNSIMHFQKQGISLPAILQYLNKANISELDVNDLTNLRGVFTAIRDGQSSLEQIFGDNNV